tara:strand:+ start:210 stop:1043 length:834 start_codon:yes stop_codon:yes gene_type:complete
MAVVTSVVAASAMVIGSTVQAIGAHQKAQGAKGDVARAKGRLEELENSRQAIINPYENMENLSSMASDTSGNLKNRYANIGVATQAAEMQIEEADISLANTLDTLAATGASAGGATALAQAALQSKKSVSASIEQQEVANQQKAAAAEMQIDQAKMSEEQRLQNINMSEEQRMQNADAQGKDYVFKATETRQIAGLDRAQTQVENAQGAVAQHQANKNAAIGSAIGGLGGVASSVGGLVSGPRPVTKLAGGSLKSAPINANTGAYNPLDNQVAPVLG